MLTPSVQNSSAEETLRNAYRQPIALLISLAICVNFVVVKRHDAQRMVEIVALLLATVVILVGRNSTPGELLAGRSIKPLTVFFVLGALGSTVAMSPQFAFFEVAIFLLLYLNAQAIAGEIAFRGNDALRLIMQAIAVIGAIYALKFFLDYLGSVTLRLPLDASYLTHGFSNIRFFNHTQTATFPLLILLCCLTPRAARLRWLWLAVTAYWWMALYATTGRGTLMGMAAACAVVAVVLRRTAIPYLKQVALTAILGLFAYFVLLVIVPPLFGGQGMNAFSYAFDRTAADPTSARTFLWHKAIELIVQHPLLGVGPMHFAHYGQTLYMAAHPHDWLLQIGCEWGLPALACLVVAIGLAVRALLRAGSRIAADDVTNQTIHTAMVAGTVAILVDGLVSGLFVMPQSQLAIALFLGCAMGWYRTIVPAAPAAAPITASAGTAARLAGATLVVAAMIGIGSVWPDALARLEGRPLTAQQQALNPGVHWPRLWEAGYF